MLDAAEGFPFPFPENAYELMWNHKLKYKGIGGVRYNNQIAPTADGSFSVTVIREELLGLYYKRASTIADINNILLYFFQEVESPARLAGNILLVHETLNQQVLPRQAWIYNPGQRRVRRAPNVAYDNPGTASDGLRTNDMTDMFNGAMDRFDWKVVEKKEMYVPYNSYGAHAEGVTPEEFVMPGHLNPDLMRYELHRVWVVEANLKDGMRHINPKRTFYLDEDSYQIVLIDHYDGRMQLWRASEAHSINYYDVPTFWSTVEVHYDLQSGRYVAQGFDNDDAGEYLQRRDATRAVYAAGLAQPRTSLKSLKRPAFAGFFVCQGSESAAMRRICRMIAAFALVAMASCVLPAWADETGLDIDYAELQPLVSDSLLLDVARIGDRLVAVGERGHVVFSDDGSAWQQAEHVPTRSTLTTVFARGDRLWAAGHDAVIITSGDRGNTWSRENFEPERNAGRHGSVFRRMKTTVSRSDRTACTWSRPTAVQNWADSVVDGENDFHLNSMAVFDDGRRIIAGEAGYSYRSYRRRRNLGADRPALHRLDVGGNQVTE